MEISRVYLFRLCLSYLSIYLSVYLSINQPIYIICLCLFSFFPLFHCKPASKQFCGGAVTGVEAMETGRSLRQWRRETSSLLGEVVYSQEGGANHSFLSSLPQFVGSALWRNHSSSNSLVRGLEKHSLRKLRIKGRSSGRWPSTGVPVLNSSLTHPFTGLSQQTGTAHVGSLVVPEKLCFFGGYMA